MLEMFRSTTLLEMQLLYINISLDKSQVFPKRFPHSQNLYASYTLYTLTSLLLEFKLSCPCRFIVLNVPVASQNNAITSENIFIFWHVQRCHKMVLTTPSLTFYKSYQDTSSKKKNPHTVYASLWQTWSICLPAQEIRSEMLVHEKVITVTRIECMYNITFRQQ